MLIRVLGGFLMALADSVPGVSGGTIAFLMGIYDEFIGSLNNIVSKDKEKRKAAVLFLVKLGSGWIIGMAMASIIINQIFEKHIFNLNLTYLPALLIFGCGVIAGILTVVKLLRYGLKKKRSAMMYFILGMMIGSFYAIVMGPASLKDNPHPAMTFETFNIWFFLIGGVVIFGLQLLKTMVDKRDAAKK